MLAYIVLAMMLILLGLGFLGLFGYYIKWGGKELDKKMQVFVSLGFIVMLITFFVAG